MRGLLLLVAGAAVYGVGNPVSVYGAWLCSNDGCSRASEREMADIAAKNAWLVNQGDDAGGGGVFPVEACPGDVVDRGIPYMSDWNSAIWTTAKAAQSGRNAAEVARRMGEWIEIDYEESGRPNLAGLQALIDAYRAELPYDATGGKPAARKATADWEEHIDGKPQYAPPMPPLAPAKFTGGLYLIDGRKVAPECQAFAGSLEDKTGAYVQTVEAKIAGATAECPAATCTVPPKDCKGGVGVGATVYGVSGAMGPLRQY